MSKSTFRSIYVTINRINNDENVEDLIEQIMLSIEAGEK